MRATYRPPQIGEGNNKSDASKLCGTVATLSYGSRDAYVRGLDEDLGGRPLLNLVQILLLYFHKIQLLWFLFFSLNVLFWLQWCDLISTYLPRELFLHIAMSRLIVPLKRRAWEIIMIILILFLLNFIWNFTSGTRVHPSNHVDRSKRADVLPHRWMGLCKWTSANREGLHSRYSGGRGSSE